MRLISAISKLPIIHVKTPAGIRICSFGATRAADLVLLILSFAKKATTSYLQTIHVIKCKRQNRFRKADALLAL